MKNIFLIGLLSFLLTGCDRGIICDCFDQSDDAILFTFDTSAGAQGFKPEEIDTFFVYQLARNQSNVLDTATFIFDPVRGYHRDQNFRSDYGVKNGLFLNHGSPFENGIFSDFDYIIEIPNLKTFQITNLQISGRQGGDCGCYSNTKKLVSVNGTQHDITGKDPQQNAIVLTK